MLTFQILDGGDPYYRPLEDRTLTVGSGDAATIQLSESGVSAVHAEVDVSGETCKIRAAAGETMLVNGTAVDEATLALGDRVELGSAVLVLGQQVKRPATAGDMLEPGAPRRRDTFQNKRTPQEKRRLAAILLIGGLAAYGIYAWSSQEQASVLPYVQREEINNARRQGRFEDALATLAAVETSWAGVESDRQVLVQRHRAWIHGTRDEFERLHRQYMERVLEESEREQIDKLRLLREGGTRAEKEAARILMAGIRDFRIEAEKTAVARRGVTPQGQNPGSRVASGSPRNPSRGDVLRAAPRPDWLDERLEDIRKQYKSKNYVHAIELAKATLPDVPAQHARSLLELMADIRRSARDEMHSLVSRAYAMRKQGDLRSGVQLLKREAMRFPGEGNLSYLYRELEQLSAELGVPGPKTPHVNLTKYKRPAPQRRDDASQPVKQTPDRPAKPNKAAVAAGPRPRGRLDKRAIAGTLEQIQAAERDGNVNDALGLLQSAIAKNTSFKPELARHLEEIRADLNLVKALAAAIEPSAGTIAGTAIALRSGKKGKFEKLVADHLEVRVGGKTQVVGWTDLTIDAADALAQAAGIVPESCLGIAALAYRRGDPKGAESYLVRLLRRDTELFAAASKVISRGRGEYVDAQGYTLVSGKFVAQRFVRVQKEAASIGRKLARFGNMDAKARDAALVKIREGGGENTEDAIVLALKRQLSSLADKLGRSQLPKALAKLSAKRETLDQARKHARDLIYDTKKYFYPYKPPAVSGAKHSDYNKVQKEVDARVAALRKIWMDKTQVPIAASLKRDIDLCLWTENQLGLMGEVSDRVLAHIEWVHTIPSVATLSVRNFCKTAQERADLEHYMLIEQLNEELAESLNDGESTLVEITNSYRAMFGHRPLVIDLKLHKAANGHGEEMSRLGYFNHNSPTPERRTPFRRMKLAGYDYGVSENIALGGSAEGAHGRWCRSSGHHRNLLNPSHTEVGMGNSGKYWVENFGRGTSYTDHELFR